MMRRSRWRVCLAVLALAGCSYGFAGGGLPPGIRTVAVQPFENQTTDPTIAQQVNRTIRDAMEQRLGLRIVAESQADAIVTGTVRLYEPDQPVGYRGTGAGAGERGGTVEVSKRLLRLTIDLSMVDQRTEKDLLKQRTFPADAQYDPGREAEGRRTALELLVNALVKEAQSQW
ncbi:MAG TPA: LPS assembly lipoprotein LptE [Gemmatimonadales bacterium]|nr:LPS assembly lipoprotein LptE [Gemmatimonadales bacterium]